MIITEKRFADVAIVVPMNLYTWPYVRLLACLSVCLSACLSVCLFLIACLSVYSLFSEIKYTLTPKKKKKLSGSVLNIPKHRFNNLQSIFKIVNSFFFFFSSEDREGCLALTVAQQRTKLQNQTALIHLAKLCAICCVPVLRKKSEMKSTLQTTHRTRAQFGAEILQTALCLSKQETSAALSSVGNGCNL